MTDSFAEPLGKLSASPSVAVVILNWNGWKDTLECLDSVFQSTGLSFRVVVCDNGSSDASLEKIKHWAGGTLTLPYSEGPLQSFCPVDKPIPYIEYDKVSAERGGDPAESAPLVLIQSGANLGFAGGNNVALRYCQAHGGFDYVWILNNDTVVARDSLVHLVNHMQTDPSVGMCGSKLIFYYQPSKVQAYGGSAFDEKRGVPVPLGLFQSVEAVCDKNDVERQMAYVVGASMLVSRGFLKTIGLMSEDYFLYYEEIDWAFRAHGKFGLAYCDKSHVYHKEGGSIGSSSTGEPSATSTRYLYRNRVVFNKKFNSSNFVRCLLQIGFELLVLIRRGQYKTARVAFGASVAALFSPFSLGAGHGK